MNDQVIDYSIIVPVYCNEGSLWPLFEKIRENVSRADEDRKYEIIFVDDGSDDNSFSKLIEIRQAYPRLIKIIKFTRNFGQVPAIMAGYEYAKGRCMINISADLQDPPELINVMLDSFFNEKYEIVICNRNARDESILRRWTSKIFYRIIRNLSFPNMPLGGFDYVLLSKKVIQVILKNRESNPFWQGQVLWTGFRTKFIPYTRQSRQSGRSRWTFSKKLNYLIDGVMSYSYFPLRVMSILGGIVAISGFVYAGIIFAARIFGAVPFKGWAPLMIIILILFGIQMIMLGTVGEYLWRALSQVRNRQLYIIDKIYD